MTRHSLALKSYSRLSHLLLTSPSFLCLLFLWGVNDHYFKYAYPSFWTGKLSDITSLACTPVLMWICQVYLLCFVAKLLNKPEFENSLITSLSRWAYILMTLNALAMAFLMIAINIDPYWASLYKVGLAWVQWPFWVMWYEIQWGFSPPFPQIQLTMDPSDAWTAPAAFLSLFLLHNKLKAVPMKLKVL